MNLLNRKFFYFKTGLFFGVILFFLGCKKEKDGLNLPSNGLTNNGTYYTDTITVKSEVVLVNDNIITSNINTSKGGSYMLVGAYTDPIFGSIGTTAYTQLKIQTEFIEIPAPTADSAYLFLNYTNAYGNPAESQTISVHKLTASIGNDSVYKSTSPGISYDPTPMGTLTFNASTDSTAGIVIKITDVAFLQSILEGSKNNSDFSQQIFGIALVPSNNTSGSIIRIDGGSANSAFRIFYTQYGVNKSYDLKFGPEAKKFFTVSADRSSTILSALTNNYDSISTNLLGDRGFIQGLTGIRTRISFPYLHKLRETFPNIIINEANMNIADHPTSLSSSYPTCDGLLLIRSDATNKLYVANTGQYYYVQKNDANQNGLTNYEISPPNTANYYGFNLRSYIQAAVFEQVPNQPIYISPYPINLNPNRYIFNTFNSTNPPIRLNIYFTTTK